MKNSQLSDDEFLVAFESKTLGDFHHVDHIRTAWIYLRRIPFPEAAERMAESLRHFAASKGAHQKYHETITRAWMLLVADALEQDHQASGFDAFAAAHPELLDSHALDRFYSRDVLASRTARTGFVSPDLSPLPGAARGFTGIAKDAPSASATSGDVKPPPSQKRFASQNRRRYNANFGCNGN